MRRANCARVRACETCATGCGRTGVVDRGSAIDRSRDGGRRVGVQSIDLPTEGARKGGSLGRQVVAEGEGEGKSEEVEVEGRWSGRRRRWEIQVRSVSGGGSGGESSSGAGGCWGSKEIRGREGPSLDTGPTGWPGPLSTDHCPVAPDIEWGMRKLRRAHLHDGCAGPHWAVQGWWQGLGEAETGLGTGHHPRVTFLQVLESRGRFPLQSHPLQLAASPSICASAQPFYPVDIGAVAPNHGMFARGGQSVRIPPAFGVRSS